MVKYIKNKLKFNIITFAIRLHIGMATGLVGHG